MAARLTLLERFGDAHTRYADINGTTIDVIREGGLWRAYEKKAGAAFSLEVASALSETEMQLRLDGLYL